MSQTDPRKEKLERDLFLIIHQFLLDNNLTETGHRFVEETKVFFDLDYFESLIRNGEWDKVMRYALNWHSWDGDQSSKRFIFNLARQTYLEALGRKDYKTSIRMLYHDLTPLKHQKLDAWQSMFDLLGLEDFREHPKLSTYTTDEQQRELLIADLRSLIEKMPTFKAKCEKPQLPTQKRLSTVVNQALNWQHTRCGVKDPDWFNSVTTLLSDHRCTSNANTMAVDGPQSPSVPQIVQIQPIQARSQPVEDGRTNGVKRVREVSTISPSPLAKHTKQDLPSPALSPIQSTPVTPTIQRNDIEISRPPATVTPTTPSVSTEVAPISRAQNIASLPVQDVTYISLSSPATAVRFHPVHSTLLYVATADSQLQLWNVSQSIVLQSLRVQAPIKQIVAASDGTYIACNIHSMVLLFAVQANNTLEQIHVITEHTAEVNDLKMIQIKDIWHVVSCSDDKTIVISNVTKGEKVVQFSGHESAVTAVACGYQGRMVFFCSSSKDSTIRIWMLASPRPVSMLTSPSSKWYTDFCVHDAKLFGCGVARDLLEWSTSGGNVSKHFRGYSNATESREVKFDLLNKKFLVLSDDSIRIKFWDINDEEMLLAFDPEILGSSSSYLSVSGNSNGSLLAVSCPVAHYVKVTGNSEGAKLVAKKFSKQDVSVSADNNNHNNSTPNIPVVPTRATKLSVHIPSVQSTHSPQPMQSPVSLPTDPLQPTAQPAPSPVAQTSSMVLSQAPGKASPPKQVSVLPPLITVPANLHSVQSSFNMLSVKAETDPETPIYQLLFQHNGGGLLTFGDGPIRLWKWPTGQTANTHTKPDVFTTPQAKSFNPPLPTSGPRFYSMALTSNDIYLMASCGDGVSLFHTTKLQDFGHTNPKMVFSAMALNTRDNNYLATAATECVRIQAFGYDPGEVLELRNVITKPTCIAFHNNYIAVGSEEGLLVIHKLDITEAEKISSQNKKKYNVKTFKATEDPRQFNLKHPIVSLSVNKTNNILMVATKKGIVFVNSPEKIVYSWDSTFPYSNIVAATFNLDCTMIFCILDDNMRMVLKIQGTADSPQDLIPVIVQQLDVKHGPIRSLAAHTKNPNAFAVGTQKGFFCICEFDPKKD